MGLARSTALGTPLAVFLVLSLVACGSKSANSPGGAAQCPDSQSTCLTAPNCAYDDTRQCTMCRCGPATPFAPGDYTPQGPPRGS